jgi:citrate lyase subunit beta/citryl-CoA lyase
MDQKPGVAMRLSFVRTALYVPASNIRALEKARGLDADMLMIDLEDGVPEDAKAQARVTARDYAANRQEDKLLAIRLNEAGSAHFVDDVAALKDVHVDYFVLPKVESVSAIDAAAELLAKPVLAMIETPAGLYNAREIAAHSTIAGLIAGTNDIAAEIGIRPGPQRQGLELSLQMILLAGAEAGKPCFDGVCNRLDDMAGFEAECAQGYGYGFTGKTVIHPNQIAIANTCFAPSAQAVEDAEALLAANRGGAQRFRGRMIEVMHVEEAQLTIERANRALKRD